MTNLDKYYISSMDSYEFESPRECVLMKKAFLSSGKDIAIAKISPAITGQKYGLINDINYVVLTHRHEGFGLFPITQFPCFVFIAIPLVDNVLNYNVLNLSDLKVIAWGELYKTESDARYHVFDS